MWGNLQGWLISLVIALATAGMVWKLSQPPGLSAAAGLLPDGMKKVQFPVAPASVVSNGNRSCDAGELYRKALAEYEKNPKTYEAPARANPATLVAIEDIVEAAHCSGMKLFTSRPAEIVNYDIDQPALDTLGKLGSAADTVGLVLRTEKKYEQARTYFEAAFVLGKKLADERLAWNEFIRGVSLMDEASQNLITLADAQHDASRADQVRKFKARFEEYRDQLIKTYETVGSIDEEYAGRFAGDIFQIARYSPETMWRVEAIKHLGHYRWNVASDRRGDQLNAPKVLRQIESDPASNAAVKTAARAALNLNAQQHELVR